MNFLKNLKEKNMKFLGFLKYTLAPLALVGIFYFAVQHRADAEKLPVVSANENGFFAVNVSGGVDVLNDITMTDTTTATASLNNGNWPRFNGDETLKLQGEAVLTSGSPTITATLQGSTFPTSDGLWYTLATWTITGTEDTVITVTAPPRYMRWSYSSLGSATTVINNAMQVY